MNAVTEPKAASSEEQLCRLCSTPLRNAREMQDGFCCTGCMRVYDVLKDLDEDAGREYFAAARSMGIIPDNGVFPEAAATPKLPDDPRAIRQERIDISGMTCPSCSWVMEQVVLSKTGVSQAQVDFFTGTGTITYDMRLTSVDDIRSFVAPLGYGLSPVADETKRDISRRLTFDFIAAGVITLNIMSLASVRYFESLGWMDTRAPRFLGFIEFALTVVVLYVGYLPIVRRAWAGIINRTLTMDFLQTVAIGAAFILSMVSLTKGLDDIYFDTCAGLTTIALLSRMIEGRLRDRAFSDIAMLMRMRISRVRLAGDTGERYVAMDDIQKGDHVIFHEGETIPFDGDVINDEVFVSEAVLTGEPRPIRMVRNDGIVAGSRIVEGTLHLRVRRRFEETRLHDITESIGRTLAQNESQLRSADRIAAWFSPVVILIALGAWLVRLFTMGAGAALSARGWFPSVAVLAVACPCAFSIAGVAAVTAATGRLIRQGFLVKAPEQLERLYRITDIVFDKTGTLTHGDMRVEDMRWLGEPRPELLGYIAAAEQGSLHPIAHALRAWFGEHDIHASHEDMEDTRVVPGQGFELTIAGRRFHIGAQGFFREADIPAAPTRSHSMVLFGFDGIPAGCFFIADALKHDAVDTIDVLHDRGYRVSMLSGDRQEVCDWMAGYMHLDAATGNASLDDKVNRIAAMQNEGKNVAFIGDGTNDALAMGVSSVSIAMGKSTDEALTASGFVMYHGNLASLPRFFATGHKLHSVVLGNYLWAFAFNTIFIPIAALGNLTPLAAMLLMLVSSSGVLINSLRLKSREQHKTAPPMATVAAQSN